jgi:hypothetical protein
MMVLGVSTDGLNMPLLAANCALLGPPRQQHPTEGIGWKLRAMSLAKLGEDFLFDLIQLRLMERAKILPLIQPDFAIARSSSTRTSSSGSLASCRSALRR